MPSSVKNRDTRCPVTFSLDTFGDRWSLLIIRDMLLKGYQTYGEFLEADERIATNVLADRLQQLEVFGIITKSRDPDNRRRVLYQLTEKGVDLTPVMLEMIRWGGKYDSNTDAPKAVLNRIRRDREGLAKEIRGRLAPGAR